MRTTNKELVDLIRALRRLSAEKDVGVWRAVADRLVKARTRRAEVNISRIARFTSANETVIVPGKVLGSGILDHAVTVGALKFSTSAAKAITDAGGKCLSIRELLEVNPTGEKLEILG